MFCFPSEKGSTQKGKNLFPMGRNSFLLELISFLKELCLHESNLGPVVQSIVSLTALLITNSLTVVAKVFSNTLTWGQGQGVWPKRVQNPNIVMLHIKSKAIKSRIQWCKYFAPGACLGVTRGQKVGFYFDCHTTPLRLFELQPCNCHR